MIELIHGIGNVLIYFIIAVTIVFPMRKFIRIEHELFRKILHFILLGSLLVWTISFSTWWLEVLTVVGFVTVVYPILMFFERFKTYSATVTERKKGELKSSLVVVFLMFAIVITITEGICKDRCLALASVYAWGVGDAFAALIGKKFGRHKLRGKFLSGKKSLEGTLAMFVTSFSAILPILLLRGGIAVGLIILVALVTAAVSALCELYTKDGMDTITCPLAAMTVMLLLLLACGGL